MTVWSIPTIYAGTRFRSKLEADWAMTFDHLGIAWTYEKEGHYFGDQFYLPDFHLTRSEQFVEVKAVWEPHHVRKAQALCRHAPPRKHRPERGHEREARDIVLIRCEPNGRFFGWPRFTEEIDFHEFVFEQTLELVLLRCASCEGWWFAEADGSYQCGCCDHLDDWVDVAPQFIGAIVPWPYPAPRVA